MNHRHADTRVSASTPELVHEALAATSAVHAAGLSDRGRVRSRNEDAFLIATLVRSLSVQGTNLPAELISDFGAGGSGTLLAVADGMGGHGGGDLASRVALGAIAEYVLSVMPWMGRHIPTSARAQSIPDVRDALDQALHASNARVKDEGERTRHPHMGTTLTLAYVVWPKLYLAHVGDTRCYIIRNGAAHQLTKDHNYATQLADAGIAPAGEAAEAFQNLLWNALGAQTELEPQVDRFELEPHDVVVLSSDGLNKHVPDPELAAVAASSIGPELACQELVRRANTAGGSDNITVVVARQLVHQA